MCVLSLCVEGGLICFVVLSRLVRRTVWTSLVLIGYCVTMRVRDSIVKSDIGKWIRNAVWV